MGTENIILLVLVVVVVAIGLWSTVRHFRGKGGGCCGGGDYKPRKKKLSHVAGQKTFQVEGMHCEHCKVRVEEAVNDINCLLYTSTFKHGTERPLSSSTAATP